MYDLIRRLRKHHQYFNLPGNEAHLNVLRIILQGQMHPDNRKPLPPVFEDLAALYRDHNGMPISPDMSFIPMRLMSYEEASATHSTMRNLRWISRDQYLFWTDDESNYMGVYLHEPLMGRVFLLDHDEVDHAPRFRNVRRMYEALLELSEHNARRDEDDDDFRYFRDLKTDYPKQRPDPEHDADDLAAAQVYIDKYHQEENDDARQTQAYIAMNLLPIDVREPLETFGDDDRDMYIQTRAIEIFALRKDEAAVPQIEAIIRRRPVNPRSRGISALGEIGTPASIEALLRIAHDIEKIDAKYAPSVLWRLERIGFETRREDGVFSYRPTADDEWIDFAREA